MGAGGLLFWGPRPYEKAELRSCKASVRLRAPDSAPREVPPCPTSPHLGFPVLQPAVEKHFVRTEDLIREGVLPDCGVRGLVQVCQVLLDALTEMLQS